MRNSARAAYTLLELLIVITIVGILGAMALPRLHYAAFQADAGMATVQGVLQVAQRSAIVRQTDVMVSFDTAGKRIWTVYDANGNHNYDTGEYSRWTPLDDGVRFGTPPSGVQTSGGAPVVGSALVSRSNYPTVFYHRDGAVSSELEIYVRSSRGDLSDFRALHVRQATGRVQLYKYDGTQWKPAGL